MDVQKSDLEWLINKTDACSSRYVEAEQLLLDILDMNVFQRMFCRKKILKFLKSRKDYGF